MRLAALAFLAFSPAVTAAADPSAARAVLTKHCGRCHADAPGEGGFDGVADLKSLVSRGYLTPGDPAASKLLKRIADGSMPPAGVAPRPSAADIATVSAWVADFTPPDRPSAVGLTDVILQDLRRFDRRARRFQRYFTLSSEPAGAVEMQALAKLVNSLSWHSVARPPEPVAGSAHVVRFDLRWYSWDFALWNRLLADYPYAVTPDQLDARLVISDTATRVPVVRADWFAATASRPPLYYDLLQLPQNLPELEKLLRVDATANIAQDRVIRAGFNGSGVARFNRLLERHDAAHGMYWRSYDFDEPLVNIAERPLGIVAPDRRNLFAFPLGPGLVDAPFSHAGGEAIFALPNGLYGYMLVRADNTRVDKAPTAIVSDPKRPDRAVEAGISCMSCHAAGIIPKADQLRGHVAANPANFKRFDIERVNALHPPAADALKVMAADAAKYATALQKAGVTAGQPDPVNAAARRYEADVDLAQASAEVGLTPAVVRAACANSPALEAVFGPMLAGGTVARPVWVQAFADVATELKLGVPVQTAQLTTAAADATGDADPLESVAGEGLAATFSTDGRRALVAAADRSVRIRDTEAGRDVGRLIGHTSSVWAVALSPDGTRAASGGADGTVRLWDVARAAEVRVIEAHAGPVSAVAFSGKRVVTGGSDGSCAGFDEAGGQVFRVVTPSAVHAVDAHPTRPLVAAAVGRAVWLIDTKTAQIMATWPAHPAAVAVVRFGPGGTVVTGGDDGTVRLWAVAGGRGTLVREFAGHPGGVRSVSFHGDKLLVTGGVDRAVRVSEVATGKLLAAHPDHAGAVISAVILPNGTQVAAIGRTLAVRFTAAKAGPAAEKEPPAQIPPAAP